MLDNSSSRDVQSNMSENIDQKFIDEDETTFFENPPSEGNPIRVEPLRISKEIKVKQSMSKAAKKEGPTTIAKNAKKKEPKNPPK